MSLFKLDVSEMIDTIAGVCMCFASADGTVADAEMKTAAAQLVLLSKGALDVDEATERLVQASFELKGEGADPYLQRLVAPLGADDRKVLLQVAAAVVVADGVVHADEKRLYDRLVALTGAAVADAARLLADAADDHRRAAARGDDAARVKRALLAKGWIDPFAALRGAGVVVSGGGDAFQFANAAGHLVRLEHYVEHRAFELHVTDARDAGADYACEYGDALDATLAAIVAVQDTVTLANVAAAAKRVAAVCPTVYCTSDGEMERVTP
jgi:tellurite resistance protein